MRAAGIAFALGILASALPAAAQDDSATYPSRQITLITVTAPGAALDAVAISGASCAIVDLDLGDGRTPAEVVAVLRRAGIPVVLISANDNPLAIQAALRSGAHSYVPKRLVIDQLRHAVEAAESDVPWKSPDFAAVLVPVEGSSSALEPTQQRALTLYAAGLPAKVIAARIGVASAAVGPLVDSAIAAYRHSEEEEPLDTSPE
jgi:DNA-binding NarL/FixJ family response regulator